MPRTCQRASSGHRLHPVLQLPQNGWSRLLTRPLLNRHHTSYAPGMSTVAIECPRGIDVRKYATVEKRMAKIHKTTVCCLSFMENAYRSVTESMHRQ